MERSKPIRFMVVMPVYNVEEYLEQSIRSVLEQTYDRFRLIMVDDGSPDNSGRICDTFAADDDRLTVIHQPNSGQLAARMAGLKKAHEFAFSQEDSYVLFLDSDDWLEPHAMETIASHLSRKNCDCLIYGFRRVLNGKTVFNTASEEVEGSVPQREAYRKICMDRVYNSLCRKAIRLAAIPTTDYSAYHHIRLGEDLLQTLDILKQVKTIAFISDHLYNYRVNENSMTESINYENFDFAYTVERSLLAFLREQDVHTEGTWMLQWEKLAEYVYADIMKLLFSNHSWQKKKEWLKKIRSSHYVRTELARHVPYHRLPKNRRLILGLFLNRCYTVLRLYHIWASRHYAKSEK